VLAAAAILIAAALAVAIGNAGRPPDSPGPTNLVVRPAGGSRATQPPATPLPSQATSPEARARVEVVRSSEATSEDGRATASNRTTVEVGQGQGGPAVVVHSSGTATANTGGNVITGNGTITTGDATAVGNDTAVTTVETGKDGAGKDGETGKDGAGK